MGKYKKPEPIETEELCKHGCGNKATHKLGNGKLICRPTSQQCPIVKHNNSDALKRKHAKVKEETGKGGFYNYSDIPQESKDRMNWNRNNFNADFSLGGKGANKQVLILERGHKCESCELTEWLGNQIILELEHCDGNNQNNVKENLKLLCPNCHSLTKTWRGRNINSGKIKVTDEELIEALSISDNIRQALIKVGLTPKAGNYVRCNDLIYGGLAKLVARTGLKIRSRKT